MYRNRIIIIVMFVCFPMVNCTLLAGPSLGFAGRKVGVKWYFPTSGNVYNNAYSVDVDSNSGIIKGIPGGSYGFTMVITATNITLTNTSAAAPYWKSSGSVSFNGFVIVDINDAIDSFCGVKVNQATTMESDDGFRITVTDNEIIVNMVSATTGRGTKIPVGSFLSLDVDFGGNAGVVPAPSALLLSWLGCSLVARCKRRKNI